MNQLFGVVAIWSRNCDKMQFLFYFLRRLIISDTHLYIWDLHEKCSQISTNMSSISLEILTDRYLAWIRFQYRSPKDDTAGELKVSWTNFLEWWQSGLWIVTKCKMFSFSGWRSFQIQIYIFGIFMRNACTHKPMHIIDTFEGTNRYILEIRMSKILLLLSLGSCLSYNVTLIKIILV